MIGLDTNVIVRYLVQDDSEQAAIASALIESLTEAEPGYLSLVTVVELHWVLRRAYKVAADRSAQLIHGLLAAREITIDRSAVITAALSHSDDGLDFADAVIAELGRTAGCAHTVTFDRRAAQSTEMRLLDAGQG